MIMHIKTTTGKYDFPVRNKLEAVSILQTLHRMGITCVHWEYDHKEVTECSQNG